MKTPKPFMYLVGYDKSFIKNCNTGWGCGYVAIPKDNPLVIAHLQKVEAQQSEAETSTEYVYVDRYFQQGEFEQEITYTETETISGVDYLVFGFDTAHSYNGSNHDFQYVFSETMKIMDAVCEYKRPN
jgi:hypothetical protein